MEELPLLSRLINPLIVFCIALIIRAVFAFIETSITALRLFKVKELAKKTGRYEVLFAALEQNPHRVLITTLIASSIADVTTAAVATSIMETIFEYYNLSSGLGFSAGIGVASIAIIIFGEIIPKSFAKSRGERILRSMLWLIYIVFYLLYPIVTILLRFSNSLVNRFGGKQAGAEWITSEKEIQFLIRYINEKGLMDPEKTAMLQNIFGLGELPVKDIMVPATDIISIDISTSIQKTLETFAKYHFTRLPVYEATKDNIIGMVHQKDIFAMLHKGEEKPLTQLLRPISFVPESLKVNQLLTELRAKREHIAMVLNEHGILTGLVTLEDIIEEIIGEIRDEHEAVGEKIIKLPDGSWLVDASVPLVDIENLLNITLKTEESVTLGGFLTEQLQHLPKKGERILYKGFYFQVQKANPRRVRKVLIFAQKNLNTKEE